MILDKNNRLFYSKIYEKQGLTGGDGMIIMTTLLEENRRKAAGRRGMK